MEETRQKNIVTGMGFERKTWREVGKRVSSARDVDGAARVESRGVSVRAEERRVCYGG